MKNFFVTGTDTGVGKTWFTIALMTALKNAEYSVGGMKPIATGAEMINSELINEDAKLIMQNCSHKVSYNLVNPFVFALPAAPHIAAEIEHRIIDPSQIIKNFHTLNSAFDILIMEGIGGWRVPINDKYAFSDLVETLNLSVILVVGLRLGCINHAILTSESIKSQGIRLCGWASRHLDSTYDTPMETIRTLKKRLNCPHIGHLPYNSNFDRDKLSTEVSPSFISQI